MNLADIRPAEYNPRKDLKPGDYEYEKLKGSIERFGFVEPLIVNARNNVLIGGHQRLKILLEKGETESEVVIVDLDETHEKALNIALNKIEGYWEYDKLQDLFAEYDRAELEVTGFTAAELEEMFGDLEEPDFDDEEEGSAPAADDEEEENSEDDGGYSPCTVYLSFPTKDAAEAWMAERGIEREFAKSKNIIINMEGTDDYGTADD